MQAPLTTDTGSAGFACRTSVMASSFDCSHVGTDTIALALTAGFGSMQIAHFAKLGSDLIVVKPASRIHDAVALAWLLLHCIAEISSLLPWPSRVPCTNTAAAAYCGNPQGRYPITLAHY
mmetsp:Transcript_46277/g.110115  ORF Transcript_46277/g.110115 Transcript_46277/m.110115 type:complete len:120 (-) Transcript_46277:36-395(-)